MAQALLDALREDRAQLNGPHGQLKRNRVLNGQYGPYVLGQELTFRHLSSLIERATRRSQFCRTWDINALEALVRTGDRGLPRSVAERQELLEIIQEVLDQCFDVARQGNRDLGNPHAYVSEFLGAASVSPTLSPFALDEQALGFFRITEWNRARALDRYDNVGPVRTAPRRRFQTWVPQDQLAQYLEAQRSNPGAPCPTLVSFKEDTREQNSDLFEITVAPSAYYEHVAIREYLRDHVNAYGRVAREIQDPAIGLRRVLDGSPNSNIVINVTVMSRSGKLLIYKRPVSSRSWPGVYQFGPHETMNWPQHGNGPENCFELAERALREEANIVNPEDYYGNIVFSWFGLFAPEASAYFFAHVRTRLTEFQLVELIRNAESSFEVEGIEWMDVDRGSIEDVLGTRPNGPFTSQPDSRGRQYLPHSMLSLTQLYRVLEQGMLPGAGQH